MNTQLVEIQPKELRFIFVLKKQSACSVRLANNTHHYVAFKVKTTTPKKYCVRPNVGVIMPKSTCDFTVTMQSQAVAPPDMVCKDKFLIQSTVVPDGTTDDDIEGSVFSKDNGKYIQENKLRVLLVSPPNSPILSPINGALYQGPVHESSILNDPVLSKVEIRNPHHTVAKIVEGSNMLNGDRLKAAKLEELKPRKDVVNSQEFKFTNYAELKPKEGFIERLGSKPKESFTESMGLKLKEGLNENMGLKPREDFIESLGLKPKEGFIESQGLRPQEGFIQSTGLKPTEDLIGSTGLKPKEAFIESQGLKPKEGFIESLGFNPVKNAEFKPEDIVDREELETSKNELKPMKKVLNAEELKPATDPELNYRKDAIGREVLKPGENADWNPSEEAINTEELQPAKHTELKLKRDVEFETVKAMAELKLVKDMEEMKANLNKLKSKLSEAEVTISKLTEERRLSIQERKLLQQELETLRSNAIIKKVQVGYPLLFVCMVALISFVLGCRMLP